MPKNLDEQRLYNEKINKIYKKTQIKTKKSKINKNK